MTEELEILWQLQGLDERAVVLGSALKRYPGERDMLKQRSEAERGKLEVHQKSVHDHQLKHRQVEKEIEALQGEEKKFQGQLPMVKKNEEYQALLHEIADRKSRRSDRETELLVMMEEEQKLASEKPAIDRALKSVEAEAAQRLAAIDAEEKQERDELDQIEAERRALTAKLPGALAGRYERIRVSREGRAVVPIVKGACGGCFRGQAPQVMQEARRGDRVLTCDGCGRIVILPPEG